MQIWPAIDLRGGKCVRLQQGDYGRETVFGEDPAAMARSLVGQGAHYLHLVDLDGARDGKLVNLESIRSIVLSVDVPCEIGGGIRDEDAIRYYEDARRLDSSSTVALRRLAELYKRTGRPEQSQCS